MDDFPVARLRPQGSPIEQPDVLTVLTRIADILDERLPARRPPSRRAHAREGGVPRGPYGREYRAMVFVKTHLHVHKEAQWRDVVAEGKKFGWAPRSMEKGRRKVAECFVKDGRWFWRLKPEVEAEYGQANRRS